MTVKVQVIDGDQKHNVVVTSTPILMGRSSSAQIKLSDPMVSGKHCHVYLENGLLTIKDLETTNGTYVDGQKISEAKLNLETIVKIGKVEITVDSSEMSEEEKNLHQDSSKTVVTFLTSQAVSVDASIKQETTKQTDVEKNGPTSKEETSASASGSPHDFSIQQNIKINEFSESMKDKEKVLRSQKSGDLGIELQKSKQVERIKELKKQGVIKNVNQGDLKKKYVKETFLEKILRIIGKLVSKATTEEKKTSDSDE